MKPTIWGATGLEGMGELQITIWGLKRSTSASNSLESASATSTSERNIRIASAIAVMYARYSFSNAKRIFKFFDLSCRLNASRKGSGRQLRCYCYYYSTLVRAQAQASQWNLSFRSLRLQLSRSRVDCIHRVAEKGPSRKLLFHIRLVSGAESRPMAPC